LGFFEVGVGVFWVGVNSVLAVFLVRKKNNFTY